LRTLSRARSFLQIQTPQGFAEGKNFGLGEIQNPHANKRNMFASVGRLRKGGCERILQIV
jgi:hypothetical protein